LILARISRAIREQSWFAVALEFIIVISGVVVGFQVSEWAANARERAEDERALARLRLESEAVVEYWADSVDARMEWDRQRLALLHALESGSVAPGEEMSVYLGLERLYFYPAITPPRTVFDELLASGGLARISDPDAQAAVSEYADTLTFLIGQLDQFRTSTEPGLAALNGHVFSQHDPTSPSLRRFEYDIAALSADREFVSSIVNAARNQRVFFFFRLSALRRAYEMCEALSRAQGDICETAQVGRDKYEEAQAYIDNMLEPDE